MILPDLAAGASEYTSGVLYNLPGGASEVLGRSVAVVPDLSGNGQPDVVATNQPEGGGLAMANRFDGTATRDGSVPVAPGSETPPNSCACEA